MLANITYGTGIIDCLFNTKIGNIILIIVNVDTFHDIIDFHYTLVSHGIILSVRVYNIVFNIK